MSEQLHLPDSADKKSIYEALIPQIRGLLNDEPDLIANMANISAVLKQSFNLLWAGFYLVKNHELVLGPFQGPIACTRIAFGKGVCGRSWEQKETIIVPDVDKFSGHIACSSEARSEIVIPGLRKKNVAFVLDIDSNKVDAFDRLDAKFLELIVADIIGYSHF